MPICNNLIYACVFGIFFAKFTDTIWLLLVIGKFLFTSAGVFNYLIKVKNFKDNFFGFYFRL